MSCHVMGGVFFYLLGSGVEGAHVWKSMGKNSFKWSFLLGMSLIMILIRYYGWLVEKAGFLVHSWNKFCRKVSEVSRMCCKNVMTITSYQQF